jgi:hypothetical protein
MVEELSVVLASDMNIIMSDLANYKPSARKRKLGRSTAKVHSNAKSMGMAAGKMAAGRFKEANN